MPVKLPLVFLDKLANFIIIDRLPRNIVLLSAKSAVQ